MSSDYEQNHRQLIRSNQRRPIPIIEIDQGTDEDPAPLGLLRTTRSRLSNASSADLGYVSGADARRSPSIVYSGFNNFHHAHDLTNCECHKMSLQSNMLAVPCHLHSRRCSTSSTFSSTCSDDVFEDSPRSPSVLSQWSHDNDDMYNSLYLADGDGLRRRSSVLDGISRSSSLTGTIYLCSSNTLTALSMSFGRHNGDCAKR